MNYRTPWHWLPLELRAIPEYALAIGWHARRVPLAQGDGHPVLVIPGFGADDAATTPLRRALRRAGHDALGWGLGRNLGMTRALGQELHARVRAITDAAGQPVSLIGWSLGGVFARELARREPQSIRQVITLGSPIQDGDHTTVGALFRLRNPSAATATPEDVRRARAVPPPVPCAAIYTRTDGVVPWQAAVEQDHPSTRNILVRGSHMGLPANPAVWQACARLLARPPS